jgi:hypothetical protein
MIAFGINCNDGIGDGMSCHQVGEFLSVVKDDHAGAAKVYEKNCLAKNYGPSCFNLGRLHCTSDLMQSFLFKISYYITSGG